MYSTKNVLVSCQAVITFNYADKYLCHFVCTFFVVFVHISTTTITTITAEEKHNNFK